MIIQAKASSLYALSAVVGVAGGKMETGIPWWAIIGAIVVFSCLLGIFSTHTANGDAPVTKGDMTRMLDARDVTLMGIRETFDRLQMEPLGTDGTLWAPLPDGTTAVKLPDGTLRLATPKRIAATATGTISGVMSASPVVRRADDD